MSGYRRIMTADLTKARILSNALLGTGYFELASTIHLPKKGKLNATEDKPGGASDDPRDYVYGLPVVAFAFSDKFKKDNPDIKQRWIQLQLRGIGWIVPKWVNQTRWSGTACADTVLFLATSCRPTARNMKSSASSFAKA
jgi:glutamate decarboxylase